MKQVYADPAFVQSHFELSAYKEMQTQKVARAFVELYEAIRDEYGMLQILVVQKEEYGLACRVLGRAK